MLLRKLLCLAALATIMFTPVLVRNETAVAQAPNEVETPAGVPPEYEKGSGLREALGLSPDATVDEAQQALYDQNEIADMGVTARSYGRQHSPVFGGTYLVSRNGRTFLHVLVTNERDEHARRLRGTVGRPERLVVGAAEHSLQELETLHEEIFDDRARLESDGVHVVSIGVDEPGNVLKLGITGLDDEDRSLLRSRYGSDQVRLEEATAATPAASESADAPPMKGGLLIAQSGQKCTSGFPISKDGSSDTDIGYYTAGHCALAFSSVNDWYHDGYIAYEAPFKQFSGNIDGTAIDIPGWYPLSSWKSHLLRVTSSYYRRVTNRQEKANDQIGSAVCAAGAERSRLNDGVAVICGGLTERNASFECGGAWLTAQRKWNQEMMGGDSGGPVYGPLEEVNSSLGNASAKGIHSCVNKGESWSSYGHIEWLDSASGWHVRIYP